MKNDTPRQKDWIQDHRVRWELARELEMVRGRGLQQTGYTLRLYGRFDPSGLDDPGASAARIHARLRALAIDAVSSLQVPALLRFQPPGRAVVACGPRLLIDVELTVVASPPDAKHPRPAAEVQHAIAALKDALRAMGVRST